MVMQKGFTLLETLLSVAIVGVIAAMAIPVAHILQAKNNMYIATGTVAHALREAQFYSSTMKEDSQWGIYIDAPTITVFKGSSYSMRDTNSDGQYTLPSFLQLSGVREVLFVKNSMSPQNTGTITLTSATNDTKSITINERGMFTY